MRRALIVTGVLGLGTAFVFGAAAVTAYLFPSGATVAAGWNGSVINDRGMILGPMPAKGPVFVPDSGGDIQIMTPDGVSN
jgi:hypothetical protein